MRGLSPAQAGGSIDVDESVGDFDVSVRAPPQAPSTMRYMLLLNCVDTPGVSPMSEWAPEERGAAARR
jgi:hypothetical protein